MEKSDGYNPFTYIRSENDILRLITNLISNTTPPESKSNDPFWEKSEGMLLQALFLFVWMELPKEKQYIKWLILIRGFQPILDDKFDTFSLPEFKRTTNGGGTPYVHQKKGKEPFRMLNEESVVYLQNQTERKVSILTLSW